MATRKKEDLDWQERQRLQLLEARVIWAGGIALPDLAAAFGGGEAQAASDCALYQQLAPGNLRFDVPADRYIATDRFVPQFLRGTAQEFLQVLRNHAAVPDAPLALVAARTAPVEALELPEREFDVRILQRVTAAIREGRWLQVEYQSLSRPEPRSLEIAPHCLVYAGRWHARAFSREHRDYRDFLLSRIRGIPELRGPHEHPAAKDWDWQKFVTVKIGAHPELAEAQRRVVEGDYGMKSGVFERTVRVALVPYLLRMLNVGRDDLLRRPQEQQIVLLNRSDVEPFDRLGSA